MPMRSSSLANNPLAITRELDGRYDVVLQVRDNLDLIDQVAGVDFAAILAELESAQDNSHSHTFSNLTAKPTTLSGYGIADAYTKTEVDNKISAKDLTSTAYTVEIIDELINVPVEFNTVIVQDINRGGTFVAKTEVDIDPNTGSLYTVNGGTVFAKSGGGFWVRQYSGEVNLEWFGAKGNGKSYKSTYYACEPFLGFNNGTTNTSIFTNSQATSQGLAYIDGKIFIKQRVSGTSDKTDELSRIVEFNYREDNTVVSDNIFTNILAIGHQGLGAFKEDGDIKLVSGVTTEVGKTGTDYGKSYTKIHWDGTQEPTTQSYQLFGYSDSTHHYKDYYAGTVGCSSDGKYILFSALKIDVSSTNFIFIYDRAEIESASNPLNVKPLTMFSLLKPATESNSLQGITANEKYIYVQYGYYNPINNHVIRVLDYEGNIVNEFTERHQYETLGLDSTYITSSYEPEGIAVTEKGELLCLNMEVVRQVGNIVGFKGANYACIINNSNKSPLFQDYWVKTNLAQNVGEWNDITNYVNNDTYYKKSKKIIRVAFDNDGVLLADNNTKNRAAVAVPSSSIDIAYEYGNSFQLKAYNEQTDTYLNAYQIEGSSLGTKFSFFDNKGGTNNLSPFLIDVINNDTKKVTYIRQSGSAENGAGINMYGGDTSNNYMTFLTGGYSSFMFNYTGQYRAYYNSNDGRYLQLNPNTAMDGVELRSNQVVPNGSGMNFYNITASNGGAVIVYAGGTGRLYLESSGNLRPYADNTQTLGTYIYRWSTIYAGTGTINTSDDRVKTYLDITETEKLVAQELKGNMKKFKFNESIEEKGEDKARIHFGTSAQTVKAIFESHGLVAEDYALLCYDEWEEQEELKDEEGNITQEYREAGNRYGIRYEELLCFIISAM